ncbi:hypothetical protein [Alteromonas sp. 14N.309.X.WAT.G.H12]|uniref:hypothetical protein n=1 Tax=Alteromonas sp. 14N.309.X.WAT.G.H12 TaxID=3120824 RepID=UPI002FD511DF
MVLQGESGALAGGGFGGTVDGVLGGLPGALVIGGMGAGIGFISGLVSYALR